MRGPNSPFFSLSNYNNPRIHQKQQNRKSVLFADFRFTGIRFRKATHFPFRCSTKNNNNLFTKGAVVPFGQKNVRIQKEI